MAEFKIRDKQTGEIMTITADSPEDAKRMAMQRTTTPGISDELPEDVALKKIRGTGALPTLEETEMGTRASRSFAGGLLTGATLGLPKLIPAVRKRTEELQEKDPAGFAAGEITSFFTPGGLQQITSKAVRKGIEKFTPKAVSKAAPKIARFGQRALTGAATGGITEGARGLTDVQEDRIKNAIKQGAKGATVEGLIEGVTGSIGDVLLEKVTPRFLEATIKPKESARRLKFDANNIVKHKIEGSLQDIVKKGQNLVDNADNQVKELITKAQTADPTARVDIKSVFDELRQEIDGEEISNFISLGKEDDAIKILNKIFESGKRKLEDGAVADLAKTRQIKTSIGRAFEKGRQLNSEEKLENTIRKLLNLKINEKLLKKVPEIAEYNKVMSELIPVVDAAEDAIVRTGKRNAIWTGANIGALIAGTGLSSATGSLPAGLTTAGLIGASELARQGRLQSTIPAAGRLLTSPQFRAGLGATIAKETVRPEEQKISPSFGRRSIPGGL